MSWENDSGFIIFMIIMVIIIIFCLFMAIRTNKKQKQKIALGLETIEEQKVKNKKSREKLNSYLTLSAVLIIGICWFFSSIFLIYLSLYHNFTPDAIRIPRILMFFYDIFGVYGGSIAQIILSSIIIISTIKKIYSVYKAK